MDDFLDSCKTLSDARERVCQVKLINSTANWVMHGWASNEPSVLKVLNEPENSNESISLANIGKEEERVLGLQWITDSDVLTFKFGETKIPSDIRKGDRKPSKREFLSAIMSVFDPLGFLSPLTIQARILMQDIWASHVKWDEKIGDCDFERWKFWLRELEKVMLCQIPRCYNLSKNVGSIELHVFCDASEKAYAAVAYWRSDFDKNNIHTAIVLAKSRVAPLKPTTIPRLELQAALLGVRLAKTILKEHEFQVDRRTFWSDSQTVLQWIRTDPRTYKTFVMNRLGEISEETDISEWRWVSSRENPADDATKWSSDVLQNNSRWFIGPSFLRKNENEWPIQNKKDKPADVDCDEVRKNVICNITTSSGSLSVILPDHTRFSSWFRLIRATARVLEAADIWLKVFNEYTDLDRQIYAEKLWMREVQNLSFSQEIKALKSSKALPRESRIISLSPILDEHNLLRVAGRVQHNPETRQKFQPVILDAKHEAVKLLIKHYHERYFHKGHETVVNEIQQSYWILGLRKSLRAIINKCSVCRILRAQPPNVKMANLPSARLGYSLRPFAYCGIDYFGPITVKIGRRREKRWGVLFTCMTVRAIHIELAHSLSTDSAIMAIQRFAARRGFPKKLFSDNGTNFKGANQEMRQAIKNLDNKQQACFALKNRFEWHFNPPTASHMGGVWERLIRSVKEALYFTLKEHAPSEETLLTVLAEVEHSVNSRPLTHVSPDPQDNEALTPNHFLLGSSSGSVQLTRYDCQLTCIRKQWRLAQHYANAFWRRWIREYLPTLLPRKKWFSSDASLKVGDLVLIADNQMPRNAWKKGLIVKTFPGSDGEVRVVEVKTANNVLIRPAKKIIKFAEVQNA